MTKNIIDTSNNIRDEEVKNRYQSILKSFSDWRLEKKKLCESLF